MKSHEEIGGEPDNDASASEKSDRPAAARRRVSGQRLEALALPIAWAVIVVIFGVLRPSTFLTTQNLSSILSSQAVLVVVTLGLMIVIVGGDYDLSVGAVVGLSTMIIAILNINQSIPVGWAILAALAAGLAVGFVNGFFIVVIGIDSLIVTLGMGTFVTGIVLWVSHSNTFSGVSQVLVNAVIVYRVLGIPLAFYYAMIIAAIVWYILQYTPGGRRLLVVGRGPEVARLSGINVRRVRWFTLMMASFIASLAGVLYAGTTGSAGPSSGLELLLPAFAAAFLGQTTVTPGRFNAGGVVIAVYFLVTGTTGLQLLGAESYVQNLFYGATLILAVAFSQVVRRRRSQVS